jgi:hypothetical protein
VRLLLFIVGSVLAVSCGGSNRTGPGQPVRVDAPANEDEEERGRSVPVEERPADEASPAQSW